MTDTIHNDLSQALIACTLDIPGALDAPEINRIAPEDVTPGLSLIWRQMLSLHKTNDLSVTSLVASLHDETLNLYYFNKLRDDYRDVSLDDLRGIAENLKVYASRRELDQIAGWVATKVRSETNPRDIARELIGKVTPLALHTNRDIEPLDHILDEVFTEIEERSKNPSNIWGIPYAFDKLNEVTGGKQKGELILFAGEPKIGKSWFTLQDALYTAKQGIPVAIFSLEMKRKQVVRRLLKLEGMDGRRMATGYMQDGDWPILVNAMGVLQGLPLYIDDRPMSLADIRPTLSRLKATKGVEYFILDYSLRVQNAGKDEIEATTNVSKECKTVVGDLDLAGTLIASVRKDAMDNTNSVIKAGVRGSGQQLHEADVVYMLTKYAPLKDDMSVLPSDTHQFVTMHVSAGRELDAHIPGGIIHFRRKNSPLFVERQ